MTPSSDALGGAACLTVEAIEAIASGRVMTPEARAHLASCQPCTETLTAARDANALLTELAAAMGSSPKEDFPEIPGCAIVGEIHRGAQGVVYEAHHEATNRAVAVKVLPAHTLRSSRQRARFEREVELTAALRHPGVVTIHDSGVAADGRGFVVMELVSGVTLAEHIRSLGDPPSTRAVLELFARIADAVDHAHQHAIIHRDLKPSNILIDSEGEPRIVDFGIARTESAESIDVTRPGDFIGTLAYAAPEQVDPKAGSVGVRTDVYALGGLLFEALTGQRLTKGNSVADAIRIITEQDAPKPSSIRADVDADTDAIVLKALAREPSHRYTSAGALRDDLKRALGGLPVEARRHIRGYVLKRTLRRHRVPIALALIAFIVVGTLLSAFVLQTIRKGRLAAAKAGIGDSLSSLVAATSVEESDLTITDIPQLVDQLAIIVEQQLADFPLERARFENDLGLAYWNLAQIDKSIAHFSDALSLRTDHRAADADVAESHHNLARALWRDHRFDEARSHWETALELRRRTFGDDDPRVAEVLHNLAGVLRDMEQTADAEAMYREALRIRESTLGADSEEVANTLNSLALLQYMRRRYADAALTARRALDIIERAHGPKNWRTARLQHSLGVYLRDSGDLDEAERVLREAKRVKLLWWDANDPRVRNTDDAIDRLIELRARADHPAPS